MVLEKKKKTAAISMHRLGLLSKYADWTDRVRSRLWQGRGTRTVSHNSQQYTV